MKGFILLLAILYFVVSVLMYMNTLILREIRKIYKELLKRKNGNDYSD